jgi:hypothetical protein
MEGRTPKSGAIKMPQPEPTALRLVEQAELPSAIKSRLRDFVRNYNLARVQNDNDIAKGYQGIFELALAFPENAHMRKTCSVLLKALAGYSEHKSRYLKTDFPEMAQNEVHSAFEALHVALQSFLTDDQKRQLDPIFRDILGKLRLVDEK